MSFSEKEWCSVTDKDISINTPGTWAVGEERGEVETSWINGENKENKQKTNCISLEKSK